MSPCLLELLLHYHYSPEPHPGVNAPAIKSGITLFLEEGMIVNTGLNTYKTTEKGKAHIKQLCQLPFPIGAFIDADGRIIE